MPPFLFARHSQQDQKLGTLFFVQRPDVDAFCDPSLTADCCVVVAGCCVVISDCCVVIAGCCAVIAGCCVVPLLTIAPKFEKPTHYSHCCAYGTHLISIPHRPMFLRKGAYSRWITIATGWAGASERETTRWVKSGRPMQTALKSWNGRYCCVVNQKHTPPYDSPT